MFENVPIEVISKCNIAGEIEPLKLRVETGEHTLLTSSITKVLYRNENNYAGITTFDFGCNATVEGTERLLELRYFVASHKWTLRKVLY